MAVSGLETQQFPQTVSSVTQDHKQATGVRPSHDAPSKTKEQQEPRVPSPPKITSPYQKRLRHSQSPIPRRQKTIRSRTPPLPLIGNILAMPG